LNFFRDPKGENVAQPKTRKRGLMLTAIVVLLGLLVLWGRWPWILPFVDPGPPPGTMVDVGGFRMHLVCEGEGGPAVIFDSGHADVWLTWFKVQPGLAKVTRVCTYDRAGIGYSDPGPRPRSRRRMVEELRTLLARASIAPPYVLVGHSFGGLNVRLYAALHPREVAGLVLVDSAHEDHWRYAPREFWQRYLDNMEEERRLAPESRAQRAHAADRNHPGSSPAGPPSARLRGAAAGVVPRELRGDAAQRDQP
jgi:pimeloyl-ACP methyl ester carboxylesterase